MTRKDFELIAGVLRDARSHAPPDRPLDYLTGAFANALSRNNARFNADRFMRAAGHPEV